MTRINWHGRAIALAGAVIGASVVAAVGSTVVLADEPACTIDGVPISAEQLADDPDACTPAPPTPEPEPATPDPVTPTSPEPTTPTDANPVTEPTTPAPTTDPGTTTEPVAPTPGEPAPPTDQTSATGGGGATTTEATTGTETTKRPAKRPVRRPAAAPHSHHPKASTDDPDVDASGDGEFQDARLFREQYTPTGRIPQQRTLSAAQAKVLVGAAAAADLDWSVLAAVAWLDSRWGDPVAGGFIGRRLTAAQWRTYGADGDDDGAIRRASDADQAATVAALLADAGSARAGLRTYFAGSRQHGLVRRAALLADYYDALGPKAVVHGLEQHAAQQEIIERVLDDLDIELYEGGRSDIRAGLIDPRVLVTIAFLSNRFDGITISSLISGHGVFTASGNVSLHSYGQAVDIAALGGETITGHQQKGGRTYRALKQVLRLPEAMQPAELISLWELGGPSFALADHDDHIHVGFKTEPEA